MHNVDNEDKMLKIFSRVRCINKDQLPRYVDGRLTHMERHLLEQHLVNCELCSEAVQILEKPKFKTQYHLMGIKVQEHIRNSTYKVPQVDKTERYQKKEKNKENVLIYFWAIAAAALLIGCIYMVQQQVKRENMRKALVIKEKTITTPSVTIPVNNAMPQQEAVVTNAVMREEIKPAASATETVVADESSDKVLYKTAMGYFLQGNLDEAMPRFTQLTTLTTSQYNEMARYQLGMCYKFRYQKAKAREMFKEVVKMNGSMKKRAQLALNKY